MSKKQVLALSLLVAIPALGLLTALVLGALEDGSEMFSGMMTAVVGITGLLALILGLSPFALMAFYPAEGFAAMGPPPEAAATGSAPGPRPATDEDDFESDEDGFEDDEFEDDGEELYADDGDEFEDEFEDDDDEWA